MTKTVTTFNTLGLSNHLLDVLVNIGYTTPTPIQSDAIPLILNNNYDIIAQAETGTGKTAAFGLPIIDLISKTEKHPQVLIITPTRELAIQVCTELKKFSIKKGLKTLPIYGGQAISIQSNQLRDNIDIIVGTPGRLMDHLKAKRLNLSEIKYIVLDEADEMLNSGFIEDIEWILSKVNPKRRSLLFSATMPKSILNLAKKYMPDYTTIKKEPAQKKLTEQKFIEVHKSNMVEVLCRVIDIATDFYGLVFCRTKREVDNINEKLTHRGYNSEAMHGDLSQHQRNHVLTKFKKKICNILVVTDVASRGIDIVGLSHVINIALPQDKESYTHRIGRTGRAGASGTAISIITPSEFRRLKQFEKITQSTITKLDIPSIDSIIERKKETLKQSLEKAIQIGAGHQYIGLATTLVAEYDPKTIIAHVLHLAFDKMLSKDQYTSIESPQKPSRGKFRSGGQKKQGQFSKSSKFGPRSSKFRGKSSRSGSPPPRKRK